METPEETQHREDYIINMQQFAHNEDMSGYLMRGINNYIHPTAIISPDVMMGQGNFVGPFCIITGKTIIGDNNRFEAYVSIGMEPEHKSFFGKENQGVVIGNDNRFREFVTVNSGCEKPTILKDGIIMLRGSHIGHDSTIYPYCVISCNVIIGGHTLLGFGVNMGIGSISHQYSRIGSYSMIGMGAIITKKVSPECFSMYVGNPARNIGVNRFHRDRYDNEMAQEIEREFNDLKL